MIIASEAARADRMKLWELGVLALLALVSRLIQLDHPPQFDELYHVLAARSWVADGTFSLGDGVYNRARLFTMLVGTFFHFFDDTLVVARLPSVLAATGWVVAVGYWTSRYAGHAAGWIAALLFCFDPGSIYLSQLARFYTLHGLLFFVAAVACYTLLEQGTHLPASRRVIAVATVVVSLAVARTLQISTLIGLLPLALWASWALARRWRMTIQGMPSLHWPEAVFFTIVVIVAAWIVVAVIGGDLWQEYRSAPLRLRQRVHDIQYYADWLRGRYPVLWTLFPVGVLVAAFRRSDLTAFSTIVFGTPFVLHSFAAAKEQRYLYYAMPFFFIVWGVALAAVWPAFRTVLSRVLDPLLPRGTPASVRSAVHLAAILLAVVYAAAYTPAVRQTRRLLLPGNVPWAYRTPDWPKAAPTLRRLADSADVVVSTALPKSLYYLGRGDVTLSATQLAELELRDGQPVEFAMDPRTGHPVISRPESIERLMACYRNGLAIVEQIWWRRPVGVTVAAADYLIQHTEEVWLPPVWRLKAFRWRNAAARPDAAQCSLRPVAGPA